MYYISKKYTLNAYMSNNNIENDIEFSTFHQRISRFVSLLGGAIIGLLHMRACILSLDVRANNQTSLKGWKLPA